MKGGPPFMAGKSSTRKSPPKKSSRGSLNTKWLNNALKSIGAATASTFKDITPNAYEIGDSTATAVKSTFNSIKKTANTGKRVTNLLSNNKYIQMVKKSMDQTLADIKAGNLYNEGKDDGSDQFADFMDDFNDSFDDFDDEAGGVNFTYIDESGDDEEDNSRALLAETINRSTEASLKASKAQIDSAVALASASMMQNQEMLGEINNGVMNIASSMDAVLSFHQENTLQFYETITAAIEKLGERYGNEEEQDEKEDTFAKAFNSKGGIDLAGYKELVKKQMKSAITNTQLGGAASMMLPFLQNDDMIEMLISHPVDYITKGLIGGMMPKVVTGTLKELDNTLGNFIPNMLSKLGDAANDPNSSKLRQMLGKMFGLNIKGNRNLDLTDRFSGKEVPFDDITKNSITEVIPKYLRESNTYLKGIYEHVTKKKSEDSLDNSEVFDTRTSTYQKVGDIKEGIAKDIQDSIVAAFQSSEFGKTIESLGGNLTSKESESFKKMQEQFFTQLANIDGNLNVSDFDLSKEDSKVKAALANIDATGREGKRNYKLITEGIKSMYENNYAIDTAGAAHRNAVIAKNKQLAELSKNPDIYNVIAAGINSDTDMIRFVDKYTGNKTSIKNMDKAEAEFKAQELKDQKESDKETKKLRGRRSAKKLAQEAILNRKDFAEMEQESEITGGWIGDRFVSPDLTASIKSTGNHLKNSMWSVMKGDTANAGREFTAIFGDMVKTTWDTTKENFIKPLGRSIFGEKDETGYSRGGLLSSVKNKTKDTFNMFMQRINGRDYVDSEGNTVSLDDKDESFVGEAKKLIGTIKDGIKEKLFGSKDDEDGDGKEGFLTTAKNKITESISEGLSGWKRAMFGDEVDDESVDEFGEKDKENIKNAILKNTPKAALGATVGMLGGMAAGGSILGTLVGGPVGGAILGLAGGILSNSDKFKNYLFGEEVTDEDGNKERIGGLISKKTQDLFGKHKKAIIGGAAIGAVKGMFFPGAGLLTSLVGGPVAGAAVGIGSTLLLKSDMFHKFLYGDEEKGKEGMISIVKSMFKGNKNGDEEDKDNKGLIRKLGMGALGAGAGALSTALLGKIGIMGAIAGPLGPIGGAVVGSALGIATAGKGFSKWLFGEKDKETGKRKGGMVQKFGNWMHVEVLGPMGAKIADIADDAKWFIKNTILENIRLPFMALRDGVKDVISPIVTKAKNTVGNFIKGITKPILGVADKLLFRPARTMLSIATDAVYGATKAVVGLPFRIIGGVAKFTKRKIGKGLRWLKNFTKGVVVKLATGIFGVAKGIFGFGKKKVTNGINHVRNFFGKLIPNRAKEGLKAKTSNIRSKASGLMAKLNRDSWWKDYYTTKKEAQEERLANKNKSKDRKALIYNRQQVARILGYDVKDFNQDTMDMAIAEAKSKGKTVHFKKNSSGDYGFDETIEEKRAKVLKSMSDAKIAATQGSSTDPEVRAIRQRENIANNLNDINAMISEFMEGYMSDGLTEEEAIERATADAKGIIAEKDDIGIVYNEDGSINVEETGKRNKKKKKNQKPEEETPDEEQPTGGTESNRHSIGDYIDHDRADTIANVTENTLDGFFTNLFGRFRRRRAEGGPVEKDKAYLVGDGGTDPSAKEIFVPKESGKILSQSKGGIRVQVEGFGKGALEGIKNFFKKKSNKSESSTDAVLNKEKKKDVAIPDGKGGFTVQSLTRSQHNALSKAIDEQNDKNRNMIQSASNEKELEEMRKEGSYSELTKQKKEADDKKAQMSIWTRMADRLENIGEKNEKHQSIFSKIFSKKGLITGLLALALPWIGKHLPGIMDIVTNGVKALVQVGSAIGQGVNFLWDKVKGIAEKIGGIFDWFNKHGARTNGESAGERLGDNIEDLGQVGVDLLTGHPIDAVGDFVLDEGNYDSGSGARVSYLANKGYDITLKHAKKKIERRMSEEALKGGGEKSFIRRTLSRAGRFAKRKLGDEVEESALEATRNYTGKGWKSLSKQASDNGLLKRGINYAKKKLGKEIAEEAGEGLVEEGLKGASKKVAKESVANTAKTAFKAGKDKLLGIVTDFFSGLMKKLTKKFPKLGGVLEKIMTKLSTKLSQFVAKHAPRLASKIGITTAARTTADAATLGLDKVVFGAAGALNGLTGAAKLFHVDQEYVDAKMKIISAAMNALLAGTTTGACFDIFAELFADVTGTDLLNMIATGIYKAISGKDKEDMLDQAQKEFSDKYLDYQKGELEKQLETQKKLGIIDQNVTVEEYQEGVKNGQYEAAYQSETDYNADQHQSLGYKIGKGFTNATKSVKKFFAGEKSYTDEKGYTYTDIGGDKYMAYDADGNEIGEVAKDAIDTSNMKETTKGGIKNSKLGKGIKKLGKGIKDTWNKGKELWNGVQDKAKELADSAGNYVKKGAKKALNIAKNGLDLINPLKAKEVAWYIHGTNNYILKNKDKYEKYNSNGDLLGEVSKEDFEAMQENGLLKKGIKVTGNVDVKGMVKKTKKLLESTWGKAQKTAKNIFDKIDSKREELAEKMEGWGFPFNLASKALKKNKKMGWFDNEGNYYVEDEGGKTYSYYNANGDLVKKVDKDDVETLKAQNLLTEAEIKHDPAAKKSIKAITSKIHDTWKAAKDKVASRWDSFKKFIMGGAGSGLDRLLDDQTAETSVQSAVSPTAFQGLGSSVVDKFLKGGSGKGRKLGGRGGEETVNGFPYYSQNDPRWKDQSYVSANADDGATMGDSGCGPTALAMVANNKEVKPTDLANMASRTGFRDETGTNAGFINYASNQMGMDPTTVTAPTSDEIAMAAAEKTPTILNGASANDGPFTEAGHYIVVTGMDSNGNVKVNDPRGKEYSRSYSPDELANYSASAWEYPTDNGGFGRRRARHIFGGRGRYSSKLLKRLRGGRGVSGDWLSIVKSVKALVAAKKPKYDQGGSMTINYNGQNVTLRPDCSGLVGCCLRIYGAIPEGANVTSSSLLAPGAISNGFTRMQWTSWDDLKEGDIITRSGHVEIFCRNEGGVHYVYNGGSTSALGSADATPTGHKQGYQVVWRPSNAGTGGGAISAGAADLSATGASGGNVLSQIMTGATGIVSQFVNAALTGDVNHQFTFDAGTTDTSTSDSSTDTASSSTGAVPEAVVNGDAANTLWTYFTGPAGYSKAAAAAILGNAMQESGVKPDNVSGKVAGGLMQWERYDKKSGRWKNLDNYAKSKGKPWTDAGIQAEFINKELPGLNYYFSHDIKYGGGIAGSTLSNAGAKPTTFEEWKKSNDVDMATRQFEGAFERAGKPMIEKRVSYAKDFYNKFAGGGSGLGVNHGNAKLKKKKSYDSKAFDSTIKMRENIPMDSNDFTINHEETRELSNSFSSTTHQKSMDNDTKMIEFMKEIISILSNMGGNISGIKTNSDILNDIKGNLGSVTNNKTENKTIITGGDNTPTQPISQVAEQRTSRNSVLAAKLAKGVY